MAGGQRHPEGARPRGHPLRRLAALPAGRRRVRQSHPADRRTGRRSGPRTRRRDPALYATITVDSDAGAAKAELEHYIRHYYGRSLDQMSAIQAYGWGSAEQCAEWLGGYVRAGARHLVLRIGSLEPEAQLKEVAEVLLPAVREIDRTLTQGETTP
ncbi:hypothetical protein ACFQ60_36610 [Streptomyces zhihengii]